MDDGYCLMSWVLEIVADEFVRDRIVVLVWNFHCLCVRLSFVVEEVFH